MTATWEALVQLAMSKIRRRGEPQFFSSSSEGLPPTHESVRRLIEGDEDQGVRARLSSPEPLRAVDLRRDLLPARMLSERVVRDPRWIFKRSVSVRSPVGISTYRVPVFGFRVPKGLYLRWPLKVRFCVQRKARKEVLFALRKVGFRGSSAGRGGRYRRSGNSAYSCR